MATKKEREQQREHARLLYMQGEPQKSIAGKVGVSAQTVTRWVADGGWEQARAAANITRPELVNKILNSINVLLEDLAANRENGSKRRQARQVRCHSRTP